MVDAPSLMVAIVSRRPSRARWLRPAGGALAAVLAVLAVTAARGARGPPRLFLVLRRPGPLGWIRDVL